ncbi:hypothetical protein [Bacillus sp. AFS017336]|uniref:hypothetical protein n=1 Tax=Bacillus sp. AFS017336 TaxID=2033489 RepID=UPI0015CF2DCA|nr:hypothetical protein [Bacillus sp. AFS017336]
MEKNEKTTPAATEVEQSKNCIICKEQIGQLELDNNEWICETCAQVMSDLGHSLTHD